ncbi:hypothetical protein BDN72DRAFT_384264 [Pluteus cervinus]|uniref:Uncharacterized protein n=1 Tax=Pluteus cervinus TaxID=181527 RepID=A0ACD3AAF0_9AGAR|nr:hypothetical protein BDN72DRAFT_384264 [Pluteus cervinus]
MSPARFQLDGTVCPIRKGPRLYCLLIHGHYLAPSEKTLPSFLRDATKALAHNPLSISQCDGYNWLQLQLSSPRPVMTSTAVHTTPDAPEFLFTHSSFTCDVPYLMASHIPSLCSRCPHRSRRHRDLSASQSSRLTGGGRPPFAWSWISPSRSQLQPNAIVMQA